MRVNREHTLQVLESVGFAVARTPSYHQTGCLVFDKGRVVAFNGEVACSGDSPFGDVTGAVPAATFMEFLRKMPEEDLDVTGEGGVLKVKGKGHRVKFMMETEVGLPVNMIEPAGDWEELHEDFNEAAAMAADCAGKDVNKAYSATCVYVHPSWVEAWDGTQMLRHRIKTGIESPFLVPRQAVKHAALMGMSHWSLTDTWLHFRNGSGYVMSCLRSFDEWYDLAPRFKLEGARVTLPKGLSQVAAYAELASKETKDDNYVTVTLMPGEVRVKASGLTAEYEARRKIGYDGPEMCFRISPTLLGILAAKYNEARVTPQNLVVDGGRWRYAVMLNLPEEKT